jgi:predicted phage terminase large subunit-like protein
MMLDAEKDSLGAYILTFFPGMCFAPHHKALISAMMKVERGELKRVIVSIPPRHGKSLIVSEHFPAWYFGRDPSRQIAVASYGQGLSETFGKKVQTQIESQEFKSIFPEFKAIKSTQKEINTDRRGVYVATSIGGSLTGKGANCLIIDDPVKDRQEAESQRMRDAAWEWYTSTARTRLMKNGAIILVLTRWHEDDLAGRILKADDKKEWTYIRIPAISDDGKALWPEMFDLDALLSIRRDIGPHEFQCLYQNDPRPKEGNVLPVAHMQYCEALPEKFSRIIQVVDSAIKTGKENDYTVISTFGELKGSMYEIDQWRDKVQYPALKKAVELNYKKHRPSVITIEDKASGQQLIQELSASYPVKAAKAVLDKVQRAGTLADCMSVGRCYLQKGLERNNVTISEMASFPSGANDDIVDTWAYGAIELVRADILPLLADVFDEAKNLYKIVGNPPYAWRYFRSMCYSAQEPSACLWWAVANDEQNYCGRFWVDAQIVVFAEMSWSKGSTPSNVASKIKQMESSMSLANCGAGPAGAAGDVPLWDEDNGPSPMIEFSKLGAKFVRAIEDEPTGWAQVRSRLFAGDLVVSESCTKLIEQIRHTTANPDKKEYADDYQQIPNLKALRFICNAFKKRPIKQAPQKIDVAKSYRTILGRDPHAKI